MGEEPALEHRDTAGGDLPLLVWRFAAPVLACSSAPLGGGIGLRRWAVNAQVPGDYASRTPADDLLAIARRFALGGDGIGMLTAAPVDAARHAVDRGVRVVATVGLAQPTWAAAPDSALDLPLVGTINVVAVVPERLSDAALVNAVATATEAKVQALLDAGVDGTGTATDAVAVVCPVHGAPEPFGGPRSRWGAALARAVFHAVRAGAPPA